MTPPRKPAAASGARGHTRLPPWLLGLFAVLGSVAGGSLECTEPRQAFLQRRGAELYGRMCAVCHGLSGEGYKADQAPAIGHADYLASASDTYLHHTIDDGRAGTTMSAWGIAHGGPLRVRDVDATIAFLRTFQRDAPAVLDEGPVTGDARRGASVYERECASCHGVRGTNGKYVAIGSAQLLANATNGFLRRAIHDGRSGTAMPPFGRTLPESSIEDVIAALRSWEKSGPPITFQQATPARPPPIPLGPVPLNPKGADPVGFQAQPGTTKADVIKHELDRGAKLALLDARAPTDYVHEHIAGAVSVPFYEPDNYFPQLPKDAWLVCYCSCPHAESGNLAAKLVANGFKKVTVLDEGLGYWRSHGYPTRSGLDP